MVHVVFAAVVRHVRGHIIGLIPRLFQCAYLSFPILPRKVIVGMKVLLRRIKVGRVELTFESEIISIHDFGIMLGVCLLGHHSQRIALIYQRMKLLGLNLVTVPGVIGFLEGVVRKRDDELLPVKRNSLKLMLVLSVSTGVVLLIVHTVIKGKNQVVLSLRKAHSSRIGYGHGNVTLLLSVVVDHNGMHHPVVGLVVHPYDISVDTVVEGSRRNLNLGFRAAYIVTKRIDLVKRLRHQVITYEKRADGHEHGHYGKRGHNPYQRHAARLYGHKLVILSHLSHHHHR